ncbi:MAG: hypothetical protein JXR18_02165 [Neptuniibacter sp.]
MKVFNSIFLCLCLSFILSGCAANFPYEMKKNESYTYLDIQTNNKFIELFFKDKVEIKVSTCYWDYIGTIDISDREFKTVKIPTTRPFHAILRVTEGGSSGASFLSFIPSESKRYKLVYIRTKKGFFLELYSSTNKDKNLKKEHLLLGSEYLPRCKEKG